jgi:methionine synthase II (cobalamin-independent)
MSRKKLESLGLKLPLFRTTSVGSFPEPYYLAKARAEFNKKKISEKTFTTI